MNKAELDRIQAERHGYFTPQWFGRLLRGDLSIGDTFWIGNYGVALVTIPASFLIALLTRIAGEPVYLWAMIAVSALFALYHLALIRAVWITLRKAQRRSIWGYVGLVLTTANAVMAIGLMAMWVRAI